MKWLLTVGIASLCFGSAVCNEKLYVTPDQVHVSNQAILINILGNLYPVSGLFRDGQGLHVMAKELTEEHTFSWTCPRGHSSPDGSGMCANPKCDFRKR